jgi:hypothetical protein
MTRVWLVMLSGLALLAPGVSAQTDFSGIDVGPGDTVYVTDPSGVEVTGQVTALSPSRIGIGKYVFEPVAGLRIERRGDPLWDGAVIGVASGLALGALTAVGECGTGGRAGRCVLAGTGWLGLMGLVIDWQHVGRTRVYVGAAANTPPAQGARRRASFRNESARFRLRVTFWPVPRRWS